MEKNFFPQRPAVTPTIYAYRLPEVNSHKGYLKIGYTDRSAKERIEEQLHTSKIKYEIVLVESAMANDGSCFTDKDIHKILESKGCHRLNPLDKTDEWFKCSALVFIDRNDKYVSYFKKFRKQKFWKLFIWYILSYSMSIVCLCITLRFILTK